VDTGKAFELEYGKGKVEGIVVTDDVVLAGFSFPSLTFGAASKAVNQSAYTFDGILGLARSIASTQGTLTPVESLAKHGLISSAITSYKISRLADQKNDGQVTFGGLPQGLFHSETLVSAKNVNQDGLWEAAIESFIVNGQVVGLKGRTGIVDTGTSLIYAPQGDAKAIHAAIPGSKGANQDGYFTIPCTTSVSVALTFGGRSFSIDPRDLLFMPVNPKDLTGDCFSSIVAGGGSGHNQWLVGDPFLKNVLFSTDADKNTLSFANLV